MKIQPYNRQIDGLVMAGETEAGYHCLYVRMYVVYMIIHVARVWINRVRLPILLVVS